MKKQKQIRQGDVFLAKIDKLPAGLEPVPLEDGKVVLAHGEATGHAHTISQSASLFLEPTTGRRYLEVLAPTSLDHQEHDACPVAGLYEVVRQCEYSPKAIRNVAD